MELKSGQNNLIEKLRSGLLVFGTCITNPSPLWTRIVQAANLDFVFIDTEHITLNRTDVSQMCHHYRHLGITPIVRILHPDKHLATQVVDDGAQGVVVPYVEKKEQVIDLVGAIKYRPLKGEYLTQVLRGDIEIKGDLEEYLRQRNDKNLCIVNIESLQAFERLDEILTTPGLDAVFIGPHDLSVSMGLPEKYTHPDFISIVKEIIIKSRKKVAGVGIHFSLTPEFQINWIKHGVNIIVHSSDMALFQQRLKEDLEKIKLSSGTQQKGLTDTSSDLPII